MKIRLRVQLRMRGVESSLLLFSLLFAFCQPVVHAGDLSLYSYLVCFHSFSSSPKFVFRKIHLKVGDGVTSGLEANGDEFRLNGKDLKILSGSLHYFRSYHYHLFTRKTKMENPVVQGDLKTIFFTWEQLKKKYMVQGPSTVLENQAKAIQGISRYVVRGRLVWYDGRVKNNKHEQSHHYRQPVSTLLICMCLGTSTNHASTSLTSEMEPPSSPPSSTWPPSWRWSRRRTCWPSSGPDLTSAESGNSVVFPPGYFMNTPCSSEGDEPKT